MVIEKVKKTLEWAMPVNGKTMIIPTEALIGWNWAYRDKLGLQNPDGLIKRNGLDERKRGAKVK